MSDLTPELLSRLEHLAATRDEIDRRIGSIAESLGTSAAADYADADIDIAGMMLRKVSMEFMGHASALVAAAKERDQLRAEVASLRRLAPPISEEAERLADGLVAESRRAGSRIGDDRFTRLAKAVRDLEEAFGNGCDNRPCYFANTRSPGGQHTNGRCRCLDALENCDEPARGRIQAREIVRLYNAAREAGKE